MGNSIIGVNKENWIIKLFHYKSHPSKIFTYAINYDIKIIGVVYFESKIWYYTIYNEIIYDPKFTQSTKHLLVNFGHHQPSAKNLRSYAEKLKGYNTYICNFEEVIEFNDPEQLPSTIVPIEELIVLVHNATINTKATNLSINDPTQNNLLASKIFNESFKSLVNHNGERAINYDNIIQKNLYGMLNSYRYLVKTIQHFGMLPTIFYKSTINGIKTGSGIRYEPANLYKKHYKDTIIHKELRKPYHLIDSDPNYYKVLMIGHGIRIGALLDKKLFKDRNLSFLMCKNIMLSNMHHNSLELDNYWNYTNNYSGGAINENAVDDEFASPEITDINIDDLKYHNIINNNALTIEIDDAFNERINHDTNTLKNKLIDKKHVSAHSLLLMLSEELLQEINDRKEEVTSNE